MKFQFDPRQPYQTSAIEAVTDMFDGQPADAHQLLTNLQYLTLIQLSEPTRLRRNSYADFCLKKKNK